MALGGESNPISLLTISDGTTSTGHWKNWFDNGLTVVQGNDMMYFGMEANKGDLDGDKQIIAWGDNTPYDGNNDDLIFARIPMFHTTPSPDELMRISTKDCDKGGQYCQGNVRVGIGTSQVDDKGTKLLGILHVKGAGETSPNVAAIYVDDPNLGIFVKSGGITVSGGDVKIGDNIALKNNGLITGNKIRIEEYFVGNSSSFTAGYDGVIESNCDFTVSNGIIVGKSC